MAVEETHFIKIENNIVYSNCIEYYNDDNKKIHLIPVLHIGEKRYFEDLIQYIGNKRCLYEYFQPIDPNMLGLPKEASLDMSYEEIFTIFQQISYYDLNRKNFDIVVKNEISNELREKLNLAREYSNISETSQIIFNICNHVHFSLDCTAILQRYLAELIDLKFQALVPAFMEIKDSEQWVCVDLKVDIDADILTKPLEITDDLINIMSGQMDFTLQTYFFCLSLEDQPNNDLRRKKLVDNIVADLTIKVNVEAAMASLPDLVFDLRNKIIEQFLKSNQSEIDEFAIFYGAGHMYVIESIIEKLGFKPMKETSIKVFGYNI